MQFTYKTMCTCSQMTAFEVNNNIVSLVTYFGGCNGRHEHR